LTLSPPAEAQAKTGFQVRVGSFDGPFDLLLSLITAHELDITEIALSTITDEFLGYLRLLESEAADGSTARLDEASEFLVVAATLLDLKIVGLLPQGELVDAEDVALLEARDLLFARLLQYRAFKEAAVFLGDRLQAEGSRRFRAVRLEDRFRESVPELVWTTSLAEFATIAALALAPKDPPAVGLAHLHAPKVSLREQAAIVVATLRRGGPVSFRMLTEGASSSAVVIARFLAVLELYRGDCLSFEQVEPLGELTLRWTAQDWNDERLASLGGDYGE
jgi:segregation and condensation protein A